MNKSKKRNIIIGSLCAVVLLMAVGYAAFQTVLNIQGTSNITSNWNIKITDVTTKNIKGTASNKEEPTFTDTTATFKTDLQSPGDSLEYEVTVTNAGNLNAKVEEVTLSDTNNPAIKFTSSGITKGDVINAGSTGTLLVKVEFLESVTSQPENTTSDLIVTLDYSQATGSTPSGESAADKLIATAVTSGDGLYEDTYEPGRYVYKGANPSNYITFNNEEWRIVSVENDGTLKIIKNESIGNKAFDSIGYRDSTSNGAGGTYCAGDFNGCNAWAKSDNFVTDSHSGTVLKDAEINTYLNNDYYNTLSTEAQNQIQSHAFGIGPVTKDNADLAEQIADENGTIWTGNIALMSVSDYLRANTNTDQCGNLSLNNTNYATCKPTNYLFGANNPWTISPFAVYSDTVFQVVSYGWFGEEGGKVSSSGAGNVSAIFPVIHLKSDLTLSGKGAQSNPYSIA